MKKTPLVTAVLSIVALILPLTSSAQGLTYHPVTPCRVLDTRDPLQGVALQAGSTMAVPLATAPLRCGLPNNLVGTVAYSINITVIPHTSHLSFLTAWATGTPMPATSILNDPLGVTMSNHAIVTALASQNRAISFQSTDDADLVVDVDGYFSTP